MQDQFTLKLHGVLSHRLLLILSAFDADFCVAVAILHLLIVKNISICV